MSEPPLAKQLNEADVKNWYQRLSAARDQDERRADGSGVAYQTMWASIKAEYRSAIATKESESESA